MLLVISTACWCQRRPSLCWAQMDCKHVMLMQWKAIFNWLLKMVVVGPRQPSRQQKPMHLLWIGEAGSFRVGINSGLKKGYCPCHARAAMQKLTHFSMTQPFHQKPAPPCCCRSIPETDCAQGNSHWPQTIYGVGALPKNPSSCWPRDITEHCTPMAPPWRLSAYFILNRFVFWWTWSTRCPQISQRKIPAHNGGSSTQADSLCGWQHWYSLGGLTMEFCWTYPGAGCSWQDGISSKWLSQQILGSWWWASALKERSWPNSSFLRTLSHSVFLAN